MQIFLIYLFLFLIGSILGWIIELLFRRFFSAKRWVNPGFMKGPWLPLYGFGVVIMFTMAYLCISFFPDTMTFYNPLGDLFDRHYVSGPCINDLIPISLMWVGMVLLEFVSGLIFIKGFKVKLWDYSNLKGNIMGIICPLFNVIWLAVAVIFYYGINPFMYKVATIMHDYMFGGNGMIAHFGFIFVMGIGYGLFIYDLVISLNLFATVSKLARNSGIIERYEEIKKKIEIAKLEGKKKIVDSIPESVKKTFEKIEEKESNTIKQKIASSLYIDPELEKNKADANYDENGRPKKMK